MLRKAQNLFWYSFIFLLPWQTAWVFREVFVDGEKWQYATGLLYISDIVLLGAFIFFSLQVDRMVWRAVMRDVIFRILFALLLWSILSALWAVRVDTAIFSTWKLFLMLLAYVVLRFGGVSLRTTTLVFLASMSAQAVIGILQWMGQYVYPSSLFGIAEHEAWRAGTSVLKTESGRWLRSYGGFEHPNVFGGALSIDLLLSVWILSRERAGMLRVALLGGNVLFVFALVLTFSRSAWAALFCSGTAILFFSFIFRNRRVSFQKGVFARTSIAIGLIVFAFSTVFFSLHEVTMSRFSESTIAREGSVSDRAAYMNQSFDLIRKHSLFGVGGGNFTAASKQEFPEFGTYIGVFQPVHMVPILVFVELGVVGFLLFFFLFTLLFFHALKSANVFSLTILSALLPILFLDHYLWTSHFGMVFLGVLLGVAALSLEENKKQT